MTIILITGGARSGKSAIAERKARGFEHAPIYIATAEPRDAEMTARIALHRQRRGLDWEEHEVPLDLADAIAQTDGRGARLVDCLTLWLSNILFSGRDWAEQAEGLATTLTAANSPVILVTNEVGMGIVPDNALAREFRDAAGFLNQRIAAMADEVILAVAGLPVKVK